MKFPEKEKAGLSKKFRKVLATPANFAFFVAIHDLIEYIETNLISGDLKFLTKYPQLKQVHQGIKDVKTSSSHDLGHNRYMTIQELNKIKKNDVSDSNPLWKKREALRDCAKNMYQAIMGNEEEVATKKTKSRNDK